MRSGTSKILPVDRNSKNFLELSEAIYAVWKGKLSLPRTMSISANSPSKFVVRVSRGAFFLEYMAVAIPPLPTFKFLRPFLVPTNLVFALELRRTEKSLDIAAICATSRTVTVEEAKRLSRKRDLPPGIHSAAALAVTNAHPVQGGLPSLGKRR